MTSIRAEKLQEQLESCKAILQAEDLPHKIIELEKVIVNQKELIAQMKMARPGSATTNSLVRGKSPQMSRPGTASALLQKTPPRLNRVQSSTVSKGQSREDVIRQFQIQQIAFHTK